MFYTLLKIENKNNPLLNILKLCFLNHHIPKFYKAHSSVPKHILCTRVNFLSKL